MSIKLRMPQWDAVGTSPDLGHQNVLKTFEMAIRHNRRTTRTELESFMFSGSLTKVGGAIAPIAPHGFANR